jgi:hypothetical protein
MAVIVQISQIQLRRGLYTDLQPQSLSPGEMGFAIDAGKLFIGPDPNYTGFWAARATPPYNSIEVLTEAARDTFARLFDSFFRTAGPVGLTEAQTTFTRRPYLEASLPPTATNWTAVAVNQVDMGTGLWETGATEEFILGNGMTVGANIEYFLVDNVDVQVVRCGRMTAIHNGNTNSDVGLLTDNNMSFPSVVGNGTPISPQSLYTTGVQFRLNRVGDGTAPYLRLEYQNTNTITYTGLFRTSVETAPVS